MRYTVVSMSKSSASGSVRIEGVDVSEAKVEESVISPLCVDPILSEAVGKVEPEDSEVAVEVMNCMSPSIIVDAIKLENSAVEVEIVNTSEEGVL
jgi:hypothetical protein